jgi:hypothetical protein
VRGRKRYAYYDEGSQMRRSFVLLIAAGVLSGSLLLGAARAGAPKSGQPVDEGELPTITVSNVRLQERAGTPGDAGNVRLDGEVLNHSSAILTEVVLRVSLTAPDSEEIQVDRRVHVAYDPAIPVEASELLAKSFTLPEAVKETLSQRKLSVSVVGATKPQ